MFGILVDLFRDQSGASAAEYALMLTIIGLVIVLAAIGLGDAIGNAMNIAADCIKTGSASCR
jgi:pilus assembly protein Flp/PilA